MLILLILIIIGIGVWAIVAASGRDASRQHKQDSMFFLTMPPDVKEQWRNKAAEAAGIVIRKEAAARRFVRRKHTHTCFHEHSRCSTYNGGPCRGQTLANFPQLVNASK
jgi:hypothetical protein